MKLGDIFTGGFNTKRQRNGRNPEYCAISEVTDTNLYIFKSYIQEDETAQQLAKEMHVFQDVKYVI